MTEGVVLLLALFYGTIILGVFITAGYLCYSYFKDKYLQARKQYKRKHLKLIKGGKRETLFKE